MGPIEDTRFTIIEDAAESLRQRLPPPEGIVWHTETGDLEEIDAS